MSTLKVTNLQKLDGSTFPVGKFGQVVQTVVTETFSTTTNVLTNITPLNVSITPTSTSSKILVTVNMNVGVTTNDSYIIGLRRDSTDIAVGDTAGDRNRASTMGRLASEEDSREHTINFLDSPNTTNSVTFQVRGFALGSNTFYLNRTAHDPNSVNEGRACSTITAMEVLA